MATDWNHTPIRPFQICTFLPVQTGSVNLFIAAVGWWQVPDASITQQGRWSICWSRYKTFLENRRNKHWSVWRFPNMSWSVADEAYLKSSEGAVGSCSKLLHRKENHIVVLFTDLAEDLTERCTWAKTWAITVSWSTAYRSVSKPDNVQERVPRYTQGVWPDGLRDVGPESRAHIYGQQKFHVHIHCDGPSIEFTTVCVVVVALLGNTLSHFDFMIGHINGTEKMSAGLLKNAPKRRG